MKNFITNFWIWYNYTNDNLSPLENVEISNAKEFEFNSPDVEKQEILIGAPGHTTYPVICLKGVYNKKGSRKKFNSL